MTENNESTMMEDQHIVIDLAVDSVELLSTLPSIGAARAEYIVQLREQGNLNLATLAHTTRLSEAFYQNLMERNLIRPVPSTSPSTDIDEGSTASDKSTSEREESKLWMVGMSERTDAKFAEMHERMGNGEANSKRLEAKVDENHAHMQQHIIDITTMVDNRDEDAKIRERKLNFTMQQLDLKIQRLKQAAAEDLRQTKEEWQKELDGVGSRTDRWEQVQSDQTRAICELQTNTQGDHRDSNNRLQPLEDGISTVSPAVITPKESPGSIEGIYRISDRGDMEATAFECLESGATSPSRSHTSDQASLQSLHEGAAGGQDNLQSSKLQGGTPDNNRPRWMSELIDSLPEGNVYTGGKGNVDPKIRGQRYQYEEVPIPYAKLQTGIDRSKHLPPPPYRSHDPMTSGRLSSPAPKRLPPNPHEHSYERPQSTGVAEGALHDKQPAGIRRGQTTHLPDRDNSYDLAPDARPRIQVSQPQTHLNIVANEGSRDPVFNRDSRLGYRPPAPDNLRRPQQGVIRDHRDVVQATGGRQYPTQSLQGQYCGHQPQEVRQYLDPDTVNNHHISSHPDQVADDNREHHQGRGRQRQRSPPVQYTGHHHLDPDGVNNHHIPSHDLDRVADDNGDHNHHRGRQRQRNPPIHYTGHRRGNHHQDHYPDIMHNSSGDSSSSSENESVASNGTQGRRPRNRSPQMPKMDTFDGNPVSWDGFYCNFKFYSTAHRWSDDTKLEKLRACLRGKAVQFIQKKPRYVRTNYRDLVHALKKRYSIRDPPSTVRKGLHGIKQLETESIEEFADRVYENVTDGYPDAGDEMVQSIAVDHFLTGCKDRQAAMIANMLPPRTISQAMKKVKEQVHNLKSFQGGKSIIRHVMFEDDYRIEEVRQESRNPHIRVSPPRLQNRDLIVSPPGASESPVTKTNSAPALAEIPSFQKELQQLIGETLRKSMQSELRKLREQSPSNRQMSPSRGCFKCGQLGHFKRDCPEMANEIIKKNEKGLDTLSHA